MARPIDIGTRIVRGAELAAVDARVRSEAYRCALACARRWVRGAAEGGAGHRARRTAQGAVILAHCAVRGIERTGGPRERRRLRSGDRIRCEAVILAGEAPGRACSAQASAFACRN